MVSKGCRWLIAKTVVLLLTASTLMLWFKLPDGDHIDADLANCEAQRQHLDKLILSFAQQGKESRIQTSSNDDTSMVSISNSHVSAIPNLTDWFTIEIQLKELWYRMKQTTLPLTETGINLFYDQYIQGIAIIHNIQRRSVNRLRSVFAELEHIILHRIFIAQTEIVNGSKPCDRIAVCSLNKKCGFGCQVHHVAYCMLVAYNTKRTLLLITKPWQYSTYDDYFQPLPMDSCMNTLTYKSLKGLPDVYSSGADKKSIVSITLINNAPPNLPWFPMATPSDIMPTLAAIHSFPYSWWLGQFEKLLLRPQPAICKWLADMDAAFRKQVFGDTAHNDDQGNGDSWPYYIGVHVRRTDKLINEASLHELSEYMSYVTEQFDIIDVARELSGKQKLRRRVVYLATDEPKVVEEARSNRNYSQYEFITSHQYLSVSASKRYDDKGLRHLIVDLHFLAMSGFLSCTFSSQVCRLAYELMQTRATEVGDRGRAVQSLDDNFYVGGMVARDVVSMRHFYATPMVDRAVVKHKSRRGAAKDADVGGKEAFPRGRKVPLAGNHWNGETIVRANGRNINVPSYLVRDVHYSADMPQYGVPATIAAGQSAREPLPDATLPKSCLVF